MSSSVVIARTAGSFYPISGRSRTEPILSSAHSRSNSISRSTTLNVNETLSRTRIVGPNDQSLRTGITLNPGPTDKEPTLITSKWTIGWQTPTLMISCYALALMIAIAHLLLFRYINGQNADGPDRVAPQTYITTASNILANAFGFSLRASLAVAFVQHLWYLLRAHAMKVSTIEHLFCVRANPLLLFRWAALKATPSLCLLALFMWGTQIATSFPPGAIEVEFVKATFYQPVSVPTFNASFMGNGSGADASNYALFPLAANNVASGFTSTELNNGRYNSLLPRIAFSTLVDGKSFPITSPCGVNCSYVVEFEGPWLSCQNTTRTLTINQNTSIYAIYTGAWVNLPTRGYNGTFLTNTYNASTLTPTLANGAAVTDGVDPSILVQENNVTCITDRARFTVNNTYTNNEYSRSVSAEPVERLLNIFPETHDNVILVPGLVNTTDQAQGEGHTGLGTNPASWSNYTAGIYRDLNHILIIDSLLYYLRGNFTANPVYTGGDLNFTQQQDATGPLGNLSWSQSLVNGNEPEIDTTNVIDRTLFNTAFHSFSHFDSGAPQFNVTQDILNDHLFNLTTSVMLSYGFWNTSANATVSKFINVYAFSQPLNLIVPYFLSLLLALPFVIMGTFALLKNGVAATDGGFMQIITTSTRSAVLDRAAAGGCLGGNESAPQELKDLKIRFGEFIGRDEPGRIERAGFGVESEVIDLKKGADYRIARWI